MAKPPADFGKRKPVTPTVVSPTATPPVKRSHHVALLLMGTMAVGGTAYAVMPRENCQPGMDILSRNRSSLTGLLKQAIKKGLAALF